MFLQCDQCFAFKEWYKHQLHLNALTHDIVSFWSWKWACACKQAASEPAALAAHRIEVPDIV